MKFLSVLFFIAALLSLVLSVLAFLGKVSDKCEKTGISYAVTAGIYAFCELFCILELTYGIIPIIIGVFTVNLILLISKYEGEKKS